MTAELLGAAVVGAAVVAAELLGAAVVAVPVWGFDIPSYKTPPESSTSALAGIHEKLAASTDIPSQLP